MRIIESEDFLRWESSVPAALRRDYLWTFNAYRVSLFLLDLASTDVAHARARGAFPHQMDQLLRAIGSISANIAEGFGRNSATDRSRIFGIALGSLLESFTWYRAIERQLPPGTVTKRFEQLEELKRLLIGAQKWLATKPRGAKLT